MRNLLESDIPNASPSAARGAWSVVVLVLRALVASVLFGCTGAGTGVPTAAQVPRAVVAVWQGTYGQDAPPPAVELRYDLDCGWRVNEYLPSGYHVGWTEPGVDGCVRGHYLHGTARVAVPGYQPDYPLSETSLTHELYHAHLELVTGDADPGHLSAGWAWEPDRGKADLKALGL